MRFLKLVLFCTPVFRKGETQKKLIISSGNNPVALEGLESKQGEEKRVSIVNASCLQTPGLNSDRCY